MNGDPGGFPDVSQSGRESEPEPGVEGSEGAYLTFDERRATPDRPGHAKAIDPWGEHGPPTQAAADRPLTARERVELLRFPAFGDAQIRGIEFADTYSRLAATTAAQLEFVDALIADEVATNGVDALRVREMQVVMGNGRDAEAEAVPTGKESLTALIVWQGQLRKDLHVLLKDGIRLAVKAHEADSLRRYGQWIAMTLETFSAELGVDWRHHATRRAAQRAALRTRETLQVGSTSPDAVGPALTVDERAAVRGIG